MKTIEVIGEESLVSNNTSSVVGDIFALRL